MDSPMEREKSGLPRWWLPALVVFLVVAPALFLLSQLILDQRCLTREDNANVRDGMTQPEIEAILGPPTEVEIYPSGRKQVCRWGRKQGMIEVWFGERGAMMGKRFVENAINYNLSFIPWIRN